MVLAEETATSVTFRFRNRPWALVTGPLGAAVLALAARLWAAGASPRPAVAVLAGFGLLLLYSTLYSLTATQWLRVDGLRHTVQFHKQNFYGLLAWEKAAAEFRELQVIRYRQQTNWNIVLVDQDGERLFLGENVLGALSRARALALAEKVGSRTGIRIEAQAEFPSRS